MFRDVEILFRADVKKADKTVEKRNEVEEMSDEEDTADYYNRYMRRLPSEPLDEHELFVRARTDMNRQQRDRTNKVCVCVFVCVRDKESFNFMYLHV